MTYSNTPTTPAGWYPDPAGSPRQRWWDGTQWTDNFNDPLAAAQVNALKAPEGAPVYTPFVWTLVALMFLGIFSIFIIDWPDYIQKSLDPSTAIYALFSPGYIITIVVSWLLYAAYVVLSYFDFRTLKRAGIPQPFHWAFSFLSLAVYLIGRGVVMRRRTGQGFATVWITIGYFVFAIVVSIVFSIWLVNLFIDMMPAYPTDYS
jgi:hypothetical protein